MFHGHLSLPNGILGIEGFVHDGRTYTYFGLFPSIIRMPILLVTSSLDGKLTPSSMLLAWLLTGLFAVAVAVARPIPRSWRLRHGQNRGHCVRGPRWPRSWAARSGCCWRRFPIVFNEDIAWSICLTLGEHLRPPRSDRATFVEPRHRQWPPHPVREFRPGDHGLGLRRGRRPHCVLVPAGSRWTREPAMVCPCARGGPDPAGPRSRVQLRQVRRPVRGSDHRPGLVPRQCVPREFLATNHNSEVGIEYVPTNLLTYLRPDGLSLSRVFPFVTLPTGPPKDLNGVLFDKLYRTASVPASTPLLFLLS